jgi:hypothetical protein
MLTLPRFNVNTTYSGTHKNIAFEIARWGVERESHAALNHGRGCWNYYIYLRERQLENFNDFWLEPEVKEFSPGGTKYVSYDYYSSPFSNISWHGGVTFWEGGNLLLPGYRYIKLGCDYSHLYDAERGYGYELSEVYEDLLQTIDELLPLLKLKPTT